MYKYDDRPEPATKIFKKMHSRDRTLICDSFIDIIWRSIFDIAAKRRKKHKNKISGLVISMCYNSQKFNKILNSDLVE